ncbi:uncharacterized protein G2W53_041242 [Senna tora]|uniref:Uncharacterized protein n=1 Tax=Senna tora TaxID=362788 RepID=A0A834W160_9FABA|nr:uncharacterized protein G2W53_041242 [Senna tora]
MEDGEAGQYFALGKGCYPTSQVEQYFTLGKGAILLHRLGCRVSHFGSFKETRLNGWMKVGLSCTSILDEDWVSYFESFKKWLNSEILVSSAQTPRERLDSINNDEGEVSCTRNVQRMTQLLREDEGWAPCIPNL